MAESERGLSEERRAYLEERIAENFSWLFGRQLFTGRKATFPLILQWVDRVKDEMNEKDKDLFPEGASREDALWCILSGTAGEGSAYVTYGIAMLWGELFGAEKFDPQSYFENLARRAATSETKT